MRHHPVHQAVPAMLSTSRLANDGDNDDASCPRGCELMAAGIALARHQAAQQVAAPYHRVVFERADRDHKPLLSSAPCSTPSSCSSFRSFTGGMRRGSGGRSEPRAAALLSRKPMAPSSTRAAFATADIRRALARLAQERERRCTSVFLGHFRDEATDDDERQRWRLRREREKVVLDDGVKGGRAEKGFRLTAAPHQKSSSIPGGCNNVGGRGDETPNAPGERVESVACATRDEPGEPGKDKTVVAEPHSNQEQRDTETDGARTKATCRCCYCVGSGDDENSKEPDDRAAAIRAPFAQESAYSNSASPQPPSELHQVCPLSSSRTIAPHENHHQDSDQDLKLTEQQREEPEQSQREVMSTQSFVRASGELITSESFSSGSNSNNSINININSASSNQLISAHPIGLGFHSAASLSSTSMMSSGNGGEPVVPCAADSSIVMTSLSSLSDELYDHLHLQQQQQHHHNSAATEQQRRQQLLSSRANDCSTSASQLDGLDGRPTGGGNLKGGAGSSFLGKLVGKKASRFRELVLQNLGRADRSTDELFDLYEVNFYRQQAQVARLTKEFKLYSAALKSYHEASKSLNKCIQQATTDYQSARHDLVCENLTHLEQLNEDLMDKLQEQVMRSIGEYLSKFDETKEKISKRHRKLIDFDSSRRLYELMLASVNKKRSRQQSQQQQQQLASGGGGGGGDDDQQEPQQQQPQQSYQSILRGLKFLSQQQQQPPPTGGSCNQLQESIASQLVDEARLLKLREQFNYCKLMYENINSELHEELPIVYEKKMKSLLQALQNYYAIKAHYHSNAGKLLSVVSEVIEECPQSINAVLGIRGKTKQQTNYAAHDDDQLDDDDDDDQTTNYEESESNAGADSDGAIAAGGKADSRDHQRRHHITGGGGGGGSSSGVGSSRGDSVVDSSSSPSGSSSAPSPECAERHAESRADVETSAQQQQEQRESGKACEPAGLLASGEQDYALLHSESVGAQADECAPSADAPETRTRGVSPATAAVEPSEDTNQPRPLPAEENDDSVATGGGHSKEPETVDGEQAAVVPEEPLPSDGGVHANAGQQAQSRGDRDSEVEIRILDTTKPCSVFASAKCEDSGVKTSEHCGANDDDTSAASHDDQSKPILYRVKTNYKYLAEDVDELCFEADEIIQVIEFDDSHEPEDGWLLGIREVNNQRGLFPANFTQPI